MERHREGEKMKKYNHSFFLFPMQCYRAEEAFGGKRSYHSNGSSVKVSSVCCCRWRELRRAQRGLPCSGISDMGFPAAGAGDGKFDGAPEEFKGWG